MADETDRRWSQWVPRARPGQFTFVMATGIVSAALRGVGADLLASVLFWLAAVGFVVLVAANLLRALLLRDAIPQTRAEGFLLLAPAPAAAVLGTGCAIAGLDWAAVTLTVITAASWLVLEYVVVVGAVASSTRSAAVPRLHDIDGSWFLLAVATQSVAVVAGATAHRLGDTTWFTHALAVLAALCWCVGLLQLVLVAVLVASRLFVVGLRPADEVAPYWVFMGAGAISVLAGSQLLALDSAHSLLDHAVVGTSCMVLWSFATWLIPLLVAMTIWHSCASVANRSFRTALWSMVFPIGMYGEASRELGAIRGTHWLDLLGARWSWVAFAVWAVVFFGMCRWWVRWWGPRHRTHPGEGRRVSRPAR